MSEGATFLQLLSKIRHCCRVALKLFFFGKLYLVTNISHLKDNAFYFYVVLIFDFVILVENVHVVIVYDCLDVLHAAIALFNFISVEYLTQGVVFWEMSIYYV